MVIYKAREIYYRIPQHMQLSSGTQDHQKTTSNTRIWPSRTQNFGSTTQEFVPFLCPNSGVWCLFEFLLSSREQLELVFTTDLGVVGDDASVRLVHKPRENLSQPYNPFSIVRVCTSPCFARHRGRDPRVAAVTCTCCEVTNAFM